MDTTFHPIIYVRGYAMTEGERNETAADPFCGFNAGSTVYRASVDKSMAAKKFVFESPVLRLAAEFQYRSIYENDLDITDPDWKPRVDAQGVEVKGIPQQSIVIYRYYDDGSELLGDGKAKDIETYACGLSDLVLRVKALVCENQGSNFDKDAFRSWQSDTVGKATTSLSYKKLKEHKVQVQIPFDSGGKPGIRGKVRLVIGAWNV